MTKPRESPFITVTWLASAMSEEGRCIWQYWFQTNNTLTVKRESNFDLVGYRIDHNRMVNELRDELIRQGLKPRLAYDIMIPLPARSAIIRGTLDCAVAKDAQGVAYECKTGQRRERDAVQLLIYMYGLLMNPAFNIRTVRGVLVYRDGREEIETIPDSFESNMGYFVDKLTDPNPPPRDPGISCEWCNLTRCDCPEAP